MARYAETTKVSSDQSRVEIERALQRYGATSFVYGWDGPIVVVGFRLEGRQIRYRILMPDMADFKYTAVRQYIREPKDQQIEWEKACRQRWRALLLIIKAKLEAVEAGITTIEDEFLSGTMLPSGETIGEWAHDQIDEAYREGGMPALLPGAHLALANGDAAP